MLNMFDAKHLCPLKLAGAWRAAAWRPNIASTGNEAVHSVQNEGRLPRRVGRVDPRVLCADGRYAGPAQALSFPQAGASRALGPGQEPEILRGRHVRWTAGEFSTSQIATQLIAI